jgi:hypothetical protein
MMATSHFSPESWSFACSVTFLKFNVSMHSEVEVAAPWSNSLDLERYVESVSGWKNFSGILAESTLDLMFQNVGTCGQVPTSRNT